MKLHEDQTEFRQLITLTAKEKHLPESAVVRDYYIVMMLQKLEQSEYAEQCVFKGGTSLSKCYPGSIDRFSEDVDLTFLGMSFSDNRCSKVIKRIEKVMTVGANTEPVSEERSNRSKSLLVWYGDKNNRIKLEIGSTVRPDPYEKRTLKTYIQEYMGANGYDENISFYELDEVSLNVLDITRTFIDKIMSVKRHAVCGSLGAKTRHIYDVVKLYQLPEIQAFLQNKNKLKELIHLTKTTDSYYIDKRNIASNYNPLAGYEFEKWKEQFISAAKNNYLNLHKDLLYTDEPQGFDQAINVFINISNLFEALCE